MKNYNIKKDGFTIGYAKGKKKAVEFINTIIDINHIPKENIKWNNIAGTIICNIIDKGIHNEFKIEIVEG